MLCSRSVIFTRITRASRAMDSQLAMVLGLQLGGGADLHLRILATAIRGKFRPGRFAGQISIQPCPAQAQPARTGYFCISSIRSKTYSANGNAQVNAGV